MTHNQEKLWDLYRSGQMPFPALQKKYLELTGEAVPDSVGRLGTNMGPITKRRHEYLQKMGLEAVARIKARQTDTPPNTSPLPADPEPEPSAFRKARGILKLGEPSEDAIRRLRDGE